jgi:hypothetical protein
MIRIRRRYTLQRIMLMIAALGLTLGLFLTNFESLYALLLVLFGVVVVFVIEEFPLAELLEFLGRKAGPTRLRRRYSLQRLMWLVVALGLPLAIVPRLYVVVPLLAVVPLEIAIVLVIAVEGWTLIDCGVLLSICLVLTGLLIPPVQVGSGPRRTPPRLPFPASRTIAGGQNDLETDEPIMCLPDPDSPAIPHTPPVQPFQP